MTDSRLRGFGKNGNLGTAQRFALVAIVAWTMLLAHCAEVAPPALDCQGGQMESGVCVCADDQLLQGGKCIDKGACAEFRCDDEKACTQDRCEVVEGKATCVFPPVADGTECADRSAVGTCRAGVCATEDCTEEGCQDECKVAEDCPQGGTCSVTVCAEGKCGTTTAADGASCDLDGGAGECTSGICQPATCDPACKDDDPYDCSEAYCVDGKCRSRAAPQASDCRESQVDGKCDIAGHCDLCANVDCSSQDDCKQHSTCNPATGACEPFQDRPDGAPCDLGSVAGECAGGTCGPATCRPRCDDADAYDCSESYCDNGTCASENVAAGSGCRWNGIDGQCDAAGYCDLCANVTCPAPSECKKPSTCDENTGACGSQANEPDGTPCSEGACYHGTCVECTHNSECTDDNPCTSDTCGGDGHCEYSNVSRGSSCSAGDGRSCDGAGNCVPCTQDSDCPSSHDACSTFACVNDQCVEEVPETLECSKLAFTFTYPDGWRSVASGPVTAGTRFVAEEDIVITALGVWEDDGLFDDHPVGLWTDDGTLLAEAVVPHGAAAVLLDSFRMVPITPTPVKAGEAYRVGVFFPSSRDAMVSSPWRTVEPEVFVFTLATGSGIVTSLTFPGHNANGGGTVSGNFAFVPD